MKKNTDYIFDYYNFFNDPVSIKLTSVGNQICKPGHFNGPKMRGHFIFHYIVSGKGIYKINNKTYCLHANQGFLIPDSSIIYYKADNVDPWHYCWFQVHGPLAQTLFESMSLTKDNPIYTAKNDNKIYEYFLKLMDAGKNYYIANNVNYNNEYFLYSVFFSLISEIKTKGTYKADNNVNTNEYQYSHLAVQYIHNNYRREDFTVSEIADKLNIDRSYLSRLFHNDNEISPKEYLIRVRLSEAERLLRTTDLPIEIIAHSVGYFDVFNFSKMFKKFYNSSPLNFKKKLTK